MAASNHCAEGDDATELGILGGIYSLVNEHGY
jgi:hypothetical protein